MKKSLKKIIEFLFSKQTLIVFLLIFVLGGLFRNYIAERDLRDLEKAAQAKFAPFLVESAVMYSYMNKFADGEDIAAVDPALPAVTHRPAAEQMSLSLEYAGGWLLRLRRMICGVPPEGEYERSYAESRFIRYALTWYLALVPALVFLMLRFLKVSTLLAAASALGYVCSVAALGRYTGQDLIKGAFALPLLAGFLCAYAASLRCRYRGRKLACAAGALCAAGAVISWDAAQFTIGLLALMEIVRALFTGKVSTKRRDFFLLTHIALTLIAVTIPYHRAHGFIFSPTMLLLLPGAWLLNMMPEKQRRFKQIAVLAILAAVSWVLAAVSPFSGNYEHFGALMRAKLRFLNQLPADAGLLTFDQRYLWTPEMHSATWLITRVIYPGLLPLLAIVLFAAAIKYIRLRKKSRLTVFKQVKAQEFIRFAALSAIAFVLYIFLMRFRDLTMLFTAIALPLGVAWLMCRKRKAWNILLAVLIFAAAFMEFRTALKVTRKYPQSISHSAELIRELRKYTFKNQTILADMQSSTLLKGYTDASILVQAKYELPEIRELTQEFVLKLFRAPQQEFVEFCARNKVNYLLLHLPVLTTPLSVPYSYRYMADCKELIPGTTAFAAVGGSRLIGNFYEVDLPETISKVYGYRLFYFTPPADAAKAAQLAEKALELYYLGKHRTAQKMIRRAYSIAPGRGKIYEAYLRICRRPPPPLKPALKTPAKP